MTGCRACCHLACSASGMSEAQMESGSVYIVRSSSCLSSASPFPLTFLRSLAHSLLPWPDRCGGIGSFPLLSLDCHCCFLCVLARGD
jgi:hypothetical protein